MFKWGMFAIPPLGEKLMALTVPSWPCIEPGKPYNPWPLCGVNIQFWAGLCHSISHPCFCASQEYSFPGRAGPSTKGQGLEWTAHILFLVQKAGDDKPILFA